LFEVSMVTVVAAPLPTFSVSVPVELTVFMLVVPGGGEHLRLRGVAHADGVAAGRSGARRDLRKKCVVSPTEAVSPWYLAADARFCIELWNEPSTPLREP
jgi:hypothetical protein